MILNLRPEHPADVKREYLLEDKFQMNKWQDTFHKHRIYLPDEERYTVSYTVIFVVVFEKICLVISPGNWLC